MNDKDRRTVLVSTIGFLLPWVLIPFLAGYLLSLALVPVPQVGIIRLEDEIWGSSAVETSALLAQAKENRAIKGVVLKINSPGGEVSASEGLYYEVLALRKVKPVVASVEGMATSGAYYLAVATDFIYATPSSTVGNIGLISLLPPPSFVDEQLLSTGPFKFYGGSRDSYIQQMEMSKEGFLAAVMAQRGEKLKADKETLARGEIYIGMRAASLGLIDALGSTSEAVEKAAHLAKIANYQVVDMGQVAPAPLLPLPSNVSANEEGRAPASDSGPASAPLPPGIYYLYPDPKRGF